MNLCIFFGWVPLSFCRHSRLDFIIYAMRARLSFLSNYNRKQKINVGVYALNIGIA